MTMPDIPERTRLLTLDEVAGILRVSRRTVRRMIERGELRAAKLGEGPNRPLGVFSTDVLDVIRRGMNVS